MIKLLIKPQLNVQLFKLKYQQTELQTKDIQTQTKPPYPVGKVNSNRLGIRTSFGNLRFMFLLPWLVGICLTLYWQVNDFYEGWKLKERTIVRLIEKSKEKYGEDYFERLKNRYTDLTPNENIYDNLQREIEKADLRDYYRIDNGKMPFQSYVQYHYYEAYAADRTRKTDIVLGTIYTIIIPALMISILSFRRRAPLFFDHQNRLIYTWRKGKVWAQYYDELIYYTSTISLDMILYGFDKHNTFKLNPFVITPSGNPFFNSSAQYQKILHYVVQFMSSGRNAVAEKDWEGRKGWYLFDDRKPNDFDEQLQTVLQYLKNEKINEQAEALAKEWGYLKTGSSNSAF
ncbi:hypothetical protein [Gynuella sunshinyii]|uniref:Uncharacterized protein n=1 Tax=Gynuella sunshinyii YC6258 TaxID=1445510 RepID=A0A0C5VF84_9GAMM|nr:hypothetical protein [Gynuella sunshinyii]AJQ97930.1 hypothetical Protein YC6258_05904 [Gynuella sunshinyii YC6258]